MKKTHHIIFFVMILGTQTLLQAKLIGEGVYLEELMKRQGEKGIRVTNPEEINFENQVKNVSAQLANALQPADVSAGMFQDDVERIKEISTLLNAFYTLFFDPAYIRYSSKPIMNQFFNQLTAYHDELKNSTLNIPWWFSEGQGEELKKVLVQGLKELCLFGRYTKHREENLVTFKLRLQHILTNIIMDADLTQWKSELIDHNQYLSKGAFYSWEVTFIKSEFKDSAALIPLFNKLAATIDLEGEQQEAERHAQEVKAEKEQIAQRKQEAAQTLRSVIARIKEQKSPTDLASRGALYLNCVRALLDPAYMDLSPQERKSVDAIKDQFKRLHDLIGKTFLPIMTPEDIETLQFLIAKSLEIIHSPMAGKTGGATFKNHIEFVVKAMMRIEQHRTTLENQIKFQWIKPLYTDNHFLTADLKRKLFNIFSTDYFQNWQASIRKFTFQTIAPSIAAEPVAEPITEPIAAPIAIESPATPKAMPITAPQKIAPEIAPMISVPKTAPAIAPMISAPAPTIAMPAPQPIVEVPAPKEEMISGLDKIGLNLISQALTEPSSVIKSSLAELTPQQKFVAINITNNAGYTPVHAAASLGRFDVIDMLLKDLPLEEKFASVTARDNNGKTPLHLAVAAKADLNKGFKPVNAVNELLRNLKPQQKVELVNMKDNNGATALTIAQSSNKAIAINLKEVIQKNSSVKF